MQFYIEKFLVFGGKLFILPAAYGNDFIAQTNFVLVKAYYITAVYQHSPVALDKARRPEILFHVL